MVWPRLWALPRPAAIEVTFNDETYLDLMSEQAIWPLIMNVMVTAFDFFAEKGSAR